MHPETNGLQPGSAGLTFGTPIVALVVLLVLLYKVTFIVTVLVAVIVPVQQVHPTMGPPTSGRTGSRWNQAQPVGRRTYV